MTGDGLTEAWAVHACRACGADAAACALDPALVDERRWLCRSCERAAERAGEGVCLDCLTRVARADFGRVGPARSLCLRCALPDRFAGLRWCYSCARTLPAGRFAAGKGRCQDCLGAIAARRAKHCVACARSLALHHFAPSAASADGRRHTCLACLARVAGPAPAATAGDRPAWPDPRAGREERDWGDWVEWARSTLADPDWIILDTETTGFGRDDVVIELAVVDGAGRTLLDTLVASPIPIPIEVQRLTGITPAMLAGAPPLESLLPRLMPLLSTRGIVAYNAPFDVRLIAATLRRAGVSWAPSRTACALRAFLGYRTSLAGGAPSPGAPSGSGARATLDAACAQMGIPRGANHRALDDALATLALLRAMAAGAGRAGEGGGTGGTGGTAGASI